MIQTKSPPGNPARFNEQRRFSMGRMSWDEARRVAENMALLPDLLQVEWVRSGAP